MALVDEVSGYLCTLFISSAASLELSGAYPAGEAHVGKMHVALQKSLAVVAAFANIDVYQAYPAGSVELIHVWVKQ